MKKKNRCSVCNKRDRSIDLFINEDEEDILLCTNCYFDLPKEEKKKLIHAIQSNVGGKYKPQGLLFGIVGSLGYSSGSNSGAHWALNRRMRKKGYTQKQIDELSIDEYNAHWDYLTIEAKQDLLKEQKK